MKQNENTKYVKLGITGAAVLAFGFAIMYILNQSKNIAAGIQLVFNILKPFLYGALIAYLLAPICNRMDERFLKWFPKAKEKQKQLHGRGRDDICICNSKKRKASAFLLCLLYSFFCVVLLCPV